MSAYALYDKMNQSDLNDIIDALLANFHKEVDIDISTLESEYANISIDWGRNQSSETEYLVTQSIKIRLNDAKYAGMGYALRLYYYDLEDGDIDDTQLVELKTKVVVLGNAAVTVLFDEDAVFVQHEADLIMTNEELE